MTGYHKMELGKSKLKTTQTTQVPSALLRFQSTRLYTCPVVSSLVTLSHRSIFHKTVNHVQKYLGGLDTGPVTPSIKAQETERGLRT